VWCRLNANNVDSNGALKLNTVAAVTKPDIDPSLIPDGIQLVRFI